MFYVIRSKAAPMGKYLVGHRLGESAQYFLKYTDDIDKALKYETLIEAEAVQNFIRSDSFLTGTEIAQVSERVTYDEEVIG